ncbi:MAG: hypothetical protein J6D29_04120 [Solobacterium sp.]|nr:hypothetical protein [Solobacterium sp.]
MRKLFKTTLLLLCCAMHLIACGQKQLEENYPTITNPVNLVTKKADMSGYRFLQDSDHAYMEVTAEESIRMFTEKGTGILYFGYVGCPWCERAVVELNKVAKENHIKVYYIDVRAQSFTEEVYYKLDPYISSIYDNGAFKVPEVVAIKEGEIVGHHLALVEGFHPEGDNQMNDEQKAELDQIYLELIEAVVD